MPVFFLLLLLLTTLPMLELFVLLEVHGLLSASVGSGYALLGTMGGILFTGVLGAALARQQGLGVLRALQESMAQGQLPTQAIMDGAMVLVGGALLLTPGFITDLFGFSLLFPLTRRLWQVRLTSWVKARIESGELQFKAHLSGNMAFGTGAAQPRPPTRDPDIIEGSFKRVDPTLDDSSRP